MKKKRLAAVVLLFAILFTACRSVPVEVLDKQRELEEAKKNKAELELSKEEITNIFKYTPKQVDIDLGTVHLKGSVRVPDVKEIPVLTLERSTLFYDEFETIVGGLLPNIQIDSEKIEFEGGNDIKSYYYEDGCKASVNSDGNIGFSDGDRFNNSGEYNIGERILLYCGDEVEPESTCKMEGKEVKLKSVIDYFNDYFSQPKLNIRPGYTFHIRTVDTRILEDGENCGVEFIVESCYKGVPFDSRLMISNDNWKENNGLTRKSEYINLFVTDSEFKIINDMFGSDFYNVVSETVTDNRLLTLEGAIGQLKNVLSKDAVFSFRSAELVYDIHYKGNYPYTDDEKNNVKQFTATPSWFFAVDKNDNDTNSNFGADPHSTYLVDAITGEVSVYL